jgi:hypothetical protein
MFLTKNCQNCIRVKRVKRLKRNAIKFRATIALNLRSEIMTSEFYAAASEILFSNGIIIGGAKNR